MANDLRLELYDPVVLNELALMANLMIAANTTEHHLGQQDIDIALGLRIDAT